MLFATAADDTSHFVTLIVSAVVTGFLVGVGNVIQSYLDRRAKRREDAKIAKKLANKTEEAAAKLEQKQQVVATVLAMKTDAAAQASAATKAAVVEVKEVVQQAKAAVVETKDAMSNGVASALGRIEAAVIAHGEALKAHIEDDAKQLSDIGRAIHSINEKIPK